MKKKKLRTEVKLFLSILILSLFAAGIMFSSSLYSSINQNNNYVPKESSQQRIIKEVVEEVKMPSKPFLVDNVKVSKSFYNPKQNEEEQIKSLIYYKNTYMQNTGILYNSDETFDVVSSMDGEVTSVTKDEILGNVVEISHSNELITIYHCLNEVNVKAGDKVKQNDVIGTSGKVNIDEGYENALLFEVNYKGNIINPEEFYNMNVKDLIN